MKVLIIAIAQLLGTSLWFSANSAAPDLMSAWQLTPSDIGWLTNAVQFGFIIGTLMLAFSGLADRFHASHIFVVGALAGACFNALFAWSSDGLAIAIIFRFFVGLSLACIYPMGMKLIVGWAPERTGAALALLVAMLTLGTALPHGLKALGASFNWQWIVSTSSLLAVVAAILIALLGDGPHAISGKPVSKKRLAILGIFGRPRFRAAALGYFGHMWELYAFWTIIPLLVSETLLGAQSTSATISSISFFIIAAGAVGCIVGGWASNKVGSQAVALTTLGISGISIVAFVVLAEQLGSYALWALLLIWGASVIADSPQFSALSAKSCPADQVGGALAIQNAIGFAITIVSIAFITRLFESIQLNAVWLLLPGPILGIIGYLWSIRHGRTGHT
ncbi:MFS transporter [Idiomarina sp. MD25a]|uniref:MFS transporter n=1 Tax=Idiomarina sp. MD25a TaxID=1889913 RepID=UPI000AAA21EE|nr:MFS transporter [Idiomarina sp. MD25a]